MAWFTLFFRTRKQMISELAASIAMACVPSVRSKVVCAQRSMEKAEFQGFVRARAAQTIQDRIEALTGYEAKLAADYRGLLDQQTMKLLLKSDLLQTSVQAQSSYPLSKAA